MIAQLALAVSLLIPVTMVSTVDSTTAKAGDPFTFRTTQTETSGTLTIPSGTLGHGVVAAVWAASGTHRGTLLLQPQYLQLSDGRQIRVSAQNSRGQPFAARRHVFPFPVPLGGVFVVGGVENPGSNVKIGPGTTFEVLLGDAETFRLPRP
ncbi:MAG TPA: hypothetical protein VIO32_03645 [Candidatus Baltobacteraceae bacterium]